MEAVGLDAAGHAGKRMQLPVGPSEMEEDLDAALEVGAEVGPDIDERDLVLVDWAL